jgi:hypothetical protein
VANLRSNEQRRHAIIPRSDRVSESLEERSHDRSVAILGSNVQRRHVPMRLFLHVSVRLEERSHDCGVAILRTFEQLAPIAQVAGPSVFKRFNVDKISEELARLNGMPAKLLYTDEEMEEIDAAQAQQAELNQILQAAPVAASAAKDIAQASAIAGAEPGDVLPNIMPA